MQIALFIAGDAGEWFYRVEDGLVLKSPCYRAPAVSGCCFFGSRPIVGELSIIEGRPAFGVILVVAVREALLSFFNRAAFEDFAKRHPEIYKRW